MTADTTPEPKRRGLEAAFGGIATTLHEQRAIWLDALHEDAIWERPTFQTPIYMVGRTAVSRFRIMAEHKVSWPMSQTPDPARLPGT